jgi:hypothetical protein
VTSFADEVDLMRDIFRGLKSYGAGSPSEQATRFRLEKLFPEVIKRAKANSATTPPPPEVDLLVSLSGFSPATTILAFELIRPRQLFVISSENTSDSIDVINEHLVMGRRLPARHFHHKACDGTDPLAIYRLVKEAVAELASDRASDGTPARRQQTALIDITGGKKVMSAAAALIAWQLDLRLCYIDSRYDGEMRQPIPGTEQLLILDNPTTIFGDQELESTLETFRSGAFAAAHERFAGLAEAMAEPSRARLLRDVAGLYQAWSDLDLKRLPSLADQVARELASPLAGVPGATERLLTRQIEFVRTLISGDASVKVVNFFVLGEHYSKLRRTDFATLLYYRTIEGAFQQRLRLRYGGFDCANPDYALTGVAAADLLERYNQVIARLGWAAITALPGKMGLMSAAVLLHVLKDPLLKRINITDVKGISHLSKQAEARNQSVLAHGYHSVSPGDCDQLRSTAQRCLRALWGLHQPEEDIDALCATLAFVRDI